MGKTWEEKMAQASLLEESETYKKWVEEKTTKEKTTDDCYTPPNIYEAIKDWAVKKYSLQGREIVRPFYPLGDYEREEYPEGCVVLDNPPFSICAKIVDFYLENNIDFFIFAPGLTLFNILKGRPGANVVVADLKIQYENAVSVTTAFITNLGSARITISGELTKLVMAEDKKNRKEKAKQWPKYNYTPEVLTSAICKKWAAWGMEEEIHDVYALRALDSQRAAGKTLYGCGVLIGEAKARELEAKAREPEAKNRTVWELSEREKEIVRTLGD